LKGVRLHTSKYDLDRWSCQVYSYPNLRVELSVIRAARVSPAAPPTTCPGSRSIDRVRAPFRILVLG
jgi:hypothetical protein